MLTAGLLNEALNQLRLLRKVGDWKEFGLSYPASDKTLSRRRTNDSNGNPSVCANTAEFQHTDNTITGFHLRQNRLRHSQAERQISLL